MPKFLAFVKTFNIIQYYSFVSLGTALNEDEAMELGGKGAVVFAEDKGDDTKHEVETTVVGEVHIK